MPPVAEPTPARSAQAKSGLVGTARQHQAGHEHDERASGLPDQNDLPWGVPARADAADEVRGAVCESRRECQEDSGVHGIEPTADAVQSGRSTSRALGVDHWLLLVA